MSTCSSIKHIFREQALLLISPETSSHYLNPPKNLENNESSSRMSEKPPEIKTSVKKLEVDQIGKCSVNR